MRALTIALVVGLLGGCAAPDRDRFEPVNRKIYRFNAELDQWVLKPTTRGYVDVTPAPVRTAVRNFFANLVDPWTAVNQFLQGKPGRAVSDGGRFLVNSTVGLGGLADPATRLGLERHEEDFGQTLAVWGLPQGDYFVVPLWGGVTTRSGVGDLVGGLVYPLAFLRNQRLRLGLYALRAVDLRAQALDAERLLRGDRYVFLRDAYLQRRRYLVDDGEPDDPFAGDTF
jgi:phospholipid-binding lipoprotein MlaA